MKAAEAIPHKIVWAQEVLADPEPPLRSRSLGLLLQLLELMLLLPVLISAYYLRINQE
jgi:hypothetical protein